MASIKLSGDTSGEITISAPAVAGTTTLTLPTTSETLATQNSLGVRNLIINGDMRIAQRTTSKTGITGTGYYTADRWELITSTAGTWTMTQDTDVPSGQGFGSSVKLDCTTANASLSSNSQMRMVQHIEAQNLQHLSFGTSDAKKITGSFWIKSNKTGTYVVWVYRQDSGRQSSKQFTIDSANTWEKKTLTFDGDTTGTIANDNGRGMEFNIVFCAGTDYTSGTHLNGSWEDLNNANRYVGQVNLADSTSNYINITACQLEVGDVATPFEHRPYDIELARCQRYYQIMSKGAIGGSYSTTQWIGGGNFNTQMRAAPSASQPTGVATVHDPSTATYAQSSTGIAATYSSTTGATFILSNFSGMNAFRPMELYTGEIHFGAEL